MSVHKSAMDTHDQEKELWQHYKSMADNLLSLTASLPVPLQHKAIDDLKKRLPDGNSLNSSLSSSSDETMKSKPQRRRGRPPKIAKQESVTSSQKKSLDADQPTQTANTGFVIRTRHQRQVEQFGNQGDTPGRFRSPIVALLKTRSRRADPEGGVKKKASVKKDNKQAAEHLKCGRKATKRKAENATGKKQINNTRNTKRHSTDIASDHEHIDSEHHEVLEREPQDISQDSDTSPAKSKETQMEDGTNQQNPVSHSSEHESNSSADHSGGLSSGKGSEMAIVSMESEPLGEQRSLSVMDAGLPEAGSLSEMKSSLEDCLPSQVVIVKRTPSVLPPDGDTTQQQEVGCSATELPADTEGTMKEETQDEIQALLSGTEADTSQMQQDVLDVPLPPQQKGRRGRKLKTTADYKCPECPKMLRSRDILREHLKTHRSQYKCETCGRKFVFKFKYEAHKQVHESGNFHKCPHCANMVMGRDRLELHIRIRHPGLEVPEMCAQQAANADPEPADVTGTPTAPLPAQPAAAGTTNEDPEAAGQPSEKTADCPVGGQNAEPTGQNSARPQADVANKPDGALRNRNRMNHVCYECKQVFRSSKKLQLHQKVAHVRMSSPCYICLRRFLYRASYDEHMDDHKKGLLKQCTFEGCSFYYKTERELQKHNARAHNKNAPRPFVCKTCNRSFWEARYLKQHMLNHDRSKTYICQTCNFVSCNLMSLRRHLASHHEMKLAHVCDLCGAKLCSKNTLHDHIKRHLNQKNVICQVCSKAFINRSQLAMHMRIHRIPRYMCSVCGKKSRTTNKLLSHMLIHTKEKPYACLVEYCNYRCRVKSNLYKHMERVHKVQHPDKYKNYHYVEQLNSCAVEVVDGADCRPESRPPGSGGGPGDGASEATAAAPPVVVTDVLYVCAYADCGYQATTQEDVANHQLRAHEPLAEAQPGDGLLGETALGFSELPIDGFDCMTIPVPVEEISDQTEAAHTLARLQSAAVTRDDGQPTDQHRQHRPDEQSLDGLDAIKKECGAFEAGPLAELAVSHVDIAPATAAADDDDKATPYAQLDDVLQMPTDDGVKREDVLLCAQQTPTPAGGEAPPGDEKAPPKTVYIVQVESEEGGTGSVSNYLELFAKSNVINFEPGTVLVNEQGSIVSVIK